MLLPLRHLVYREVKDIVDGENSSDLSELRASERQHGTLTHPFDRVSDNTVFAWPMIGSIVLDQEPFLESLTDHDDVRFAHTDAHEECLTLLICAT